MLHARFNLAVGIVALLVATTTVGIATAGPPPIGEERNGLTVAEAAALFSRDPDSGRAISLARARDSTRAIQDLANGTDITVKRPPGTAATWTRHDSQDFAPGGTETSIHPPHAGLEGGRFVKDAYTAIFAVQPSTRVHESAQTVTLYSASEGAIFSILDYRIAVPADNTGGSWRVFWSIESHGIQTIRLHSGDSVLDATTGTHAPTLAFSGLDPGNRTFTIEAVIAVTMQKKIRQKHTEKDEDCPGIDEEEAEEFGEADDDCDVRTWWTTSFDYPSEEITVTTAIPVTVYQVNPNARYARFPDGHVEVLVSAARPWSGFTVAGTTTTGTWRFYTARDTRWDTLIASSGSGDRRIDSDTVPVSVHAYPSATGAQTRPIRGPELLTVSGEKTASPQATLGDNISVDVVTQPYRQSQRILIRLPAFDGESIRVDGIVRGETAILDGAAVHGQVVRQSDLRIDVLRSDGTQATLRIQLRDTQTGRPIVLREDHGDGGVSGHDGYVSVAGRRVETNSSGVALITIEEAGIYTARYHPESWVSIAPAYTGDTARIRWHPLGTLSGWFPRLVRVLWLVIPFAVVYYAGTRLLVMLGREDTP